MFSTTPLTTTAKALATAGAILALAGVPAASADETTPVGTGAPGTVTQAPVQIDTPTEDESTRTSSDFVGESTEWLNTFWADELPNAFGITYTEPAGGVSPYDANVLLPTCGGSTLSYEQSNTNAFYCFNDDSVLYSAGWIDDVYANEGDAAVLVLLAHEWGHLVQGKTGTRDSMTSYQAEVQADCYAGVFMAEAPQEGIFVLEDGDLSEAAEWMIRYGDQRADHQNLPDGHGSSVEREESFMAGLDNGIGACASQSLFGGE